MRFDAIRHTVNEIKVTTKEYQIMSLFRENEGKVISKEDITQAVWGNQVESNCLVVLIKSLRDKLPVIIETVHGTGYRYAGEDFSKSNPFCEGE